MKDLIIDSYKESKGIYDSFREKIINLLIDLLSEQKLTIHQINGRTKTIESLSKKINEKGEKYNSIGDITDIIGIRIITYLESEVDLISNLIEKEFDNDTENSIDKRELKNDQFGYKSLHIVTQLNKSRNNLIEYKKYKGIKFEIQIRSILQHAWAEIEHDLGYKGETSIPDKYKRTFNRLSALLETADIEFDRLKRELKEYEKQVTGLIKAKPQHVDINNASIGSFITTDEVLLQVQKLIEQTSALKSELADNHQNVIKGLQFHNFKSIGELSDSLSKNKVDYLKFAEMLIKQRIKINTKTTTNLPLLYFLHFLIGQTEHEVTAAEYAKFFGIREDVAKEYIKFYLKIKETKVDKPIIYSPSPQPKHRPGA